jgi:single-stranded DNA-specific DHH superfamily exonuclease
MTERLKRIIPGLLKDSGMMKKAEPCVSRLMEAINKRERILIYGKGDREGVCSISMLVLVLRYFNANLEYFVLQELEDDNGLHRMVSTHMDFFTPGLIISLDEDFTRRSLPVLRGRGKEVLGIGHSAEDLVLSYCKEDYCLVSNVFQVSNRLSMAYNTRNVFRYVDLVFLGSEDGQPGKCDSTRCLYRNLGLRHLSDTSNYGLCACKKITSEDPYRLRDFITPRVNPNGMVDNSSIIIELLTTDDRYRAEQIAKYLYNLTIS